MISTLECNSLYSFLFHCTDLVQRSVLFLLLCVGRLQANEPGWDMHALLDQSMIQHLYAFEDVIAIFLSGLEVDGNGVQ